MRHAIMPYRRQQLVRDFCLFLLLPSVLALVCLVAAPPGAGPGRLTCPAAAEVCLLEWLCCHHVDLRHLTQRAWLMPLMQGSTATSLRAGIST